MTMRMGILVFWGLVMVGCGTTPNVGTQSDREFLRTRGAAALADFRAVNPSLESVLNSAQAYVIFPQVVSAAVGIGGAHGDGEVYQKGKFIGYADVSQGSIGAQLGAQRYAELIVFIAEGPFLNFKNGALEFDARATAIAAANGDATTADYSKGVLVFTMPESGLMAQAAVGGQKFRFVAAE